MMPLTELIWLIWFPYKIISHLLLSEIDDLIILENKQKNVGFMNRSVFVIISTWF
jgi:hypothetical protein